jgi:ribosomal protein S17
MIIKKKTWPEYFQKVLDRKKNCELRLADFDIKEGDTLILEEWDPKTKKYTGRKIEKKAKNITHVFPLDFSSPQELEKFGQYIIELD